VRISKSRIYEIIFEADTPAGKIYDVSLLVAISLSVLAVMLDSVAAIQSRYGVLLYRVEWFFTLLFTLEYVVRLWCVEKPARYARSFFGIIDFLGIIPTYLSLVFHGGRFLIAIRFLRMLRTFRVLKLSSYDGEVRMFMRALRASRRRIMVFLFAVMTLVVVLGTLMYVIENTVESNNNGFTSIPRSIYWAIVTLTTVGYGDISPTTPLGQALASVLMILGYSIIVVPTGIVSVEAARTAVSNKHNTQVCPNCLAEGHDDDAVHCKYCGAKL
jgi:voltage-gated potassium channel